MDLTKLSKEEFETLTQELCKHFQDRVLMPGTFNNGNHWFIQVKTILNDDVSIHYEVIYDTKHNTGEWATLDKDRNYVEEGVRVELHLEKEYLKNDKAEFCKYLRDESKLYGIIDWRIWDEKEDRRCKYNREIKTVKDVVDGFNELIEIFDKIILKYKKMETITEAVRLLERKRNLILAGAPGVGKTYNTAEIALEVLGLGVKVDDFDYKVDDSDYHDEVMKRYKALQDQKRIFFTTFHQSLDYEDFVEGMKPNFKGDVVSYDIEDGIFKRACQATQFKEQVDDIGKCIDEYIKKIDGYENKREIPTITNKSSVYVWQEKNNTTISVRSVNSKATNGADIPNAYLNIDNVKKQAKGTSRLKNFYEYADAFIAAAKRDYRKPVVLIIDEINRGNVSKIFGELITLIEADKREWTGEEGKGKHPIEVLLPYSKTPFSVPSNLYIIGTMNTTDRSTGTLDYALRRRFAFYTLKSDVNVVKDRYPSNDELGGKAVALFKNIEKFIISKSCGDYDVDDLMVGHSYFIAKDEDELRDKMKYEVIPLIREYINNGILNVSRDEAKKYTDEWCKLNVVAIKENQQKPEGTKSGTGGGAESAVDTADAGQHNVEDNG